jgi:hypothetical protein
MDQFSGYYKEEPEYIIYYCIVENISIEEFIDIERKALQYAGKKKHRLFKTFDTCIDYIFISKN